jgi:DMSO reductase anchor subunit DmsC
MRTNRTVAAGSIVFALTGIIFLLSTNPQKLSPILLIIPFVLCFLSLFLAIVFVTTFMARNSQPSLKRKSFFFSILLAGYPVMLVLLQSIGQLSSRDVVTLTLLCIVSGFYITRSSFGS